MVDRRSGFERIATISLTKHIQRLINTWLDKRRRKNPNTLRLQMTTLCEAHTRASSQRVKQRLIRSCHKHERVKDSASSLPTRCCLTCWIGRSNMYVPKDF